MKDYTENAPVFSPKIRIAETTDPGHADIINAAPKQLLQNTLCNQKEIGQLKKGVGIGSTGEYGTGTKYHAGEYCMYGGEMYRCLKDTEGAWNRECWVQTSPVGEIMSLRRSLESFAGLFGKDEGGNLRKLGEAAYAGISKNFDTTEEGFVPDSQLLKALKDQVDQQNSALEPTKSINIADGCELIVGNGIAYLFLNGHTMTDVGSTVFSIPDEYISTANTVGFSFVNVIYNEKYYPGRILPQKNKHFFVSYYPTIPGLASVPKGASISGIAIWAY